MGLAGIAHTNWPFFDDRHREFASVFRTWTLERLAPYEADEGNDGRIARVIFEFLGSGGWLKETVELTGDQERARVDLRRLCLMRELLAHSSVIADVALSEPWLGALPITLFGTSEQRRRYLEPYWKGRFLPAFALSEPEAGSDAASITTSAVPSGGGFRLNGRKKWTSNSGLADLYVVFARTEDDAGFKGISAFLVEGKNPGVILEERIPVSTPHTVGTLSFRDCFVDSTNLLGPCGSGFSIAMTALELFRPTVAAATLGIARRAMDEALRRSKERVAFKRPISEHQLIQEKLAQMSVKIDASALLTYRAAWELDVGGATKGCAASIAKLYSSESAQEIVDQALQIFGGYGVVTGAVVERLYRHVRAFRIFDGTSEIQKLIIAKDALKG